MSHQLEDIQAQKVDALMKQLCRATDCLEKEMNEADRVAATKNAHELVQALEQPHEAVIKLGFAVRMSNYSFKAPLHSKHGSHLLTSAACAIHVFTDCR